MKIPLLDLCRQYERIGPEIEAAALRVLRSGRYILGPELETFERDAAAYIGAEHAIGMSSGTDALTACLMALGIGPGDEVIVPTYSFFASAATVARLGARPVFVDIDDASLELTKETVEPALGPRTRAVVAVHLFGRTADVPAIREILDPRGIPVIEDAAQAIGSRSLGRPAGCLGRLAAFSFYPTKNLGALGDGGLVATGDRELAERLRLLRNQGQTKAYEHEILGANFRLDALQAAMLRVKLGHLEEWTLARRERAERWRELFAKQGLDELVRCPRDEVDRHAYHQFVIRVQVGQRDAALAALRQAGIGAAVYYGLPLHRQPCFRDTEGSFPVAERASREAIALPIFPELLVEEQEYVVGVLGSCLGK
ncbi:MAG: DegT/DnrJ/EryC1/StrS family aminotransferase [Planctomycetota bacterium]